MPYLFWGQKVKGQGHNAFILGNGLCRIISFTLHISSCNFTHRLPMSRGCALFIVGSKGQGHNALIIGNGLCRIMSFPLHLSS